MNKKICVNSLAVSIVNGNKKILKKVITLLHMYLQAAGSQEIAELTAALWRELFEVIEWAAACVLHNGYPGIDRLQLGFLIAQRIRELRERAEDYICVAADAQTENAVMAHLDTIETVDCSMDVEDFLSHLEELLIMSKEKHEFAADLLDECAFAAAAFMAEELKKFNGKILPHLTNRHVALCAWLWQMTSHWEMHCLDADPSGKLFIWGVNPVPDDEDFIREALERLYYTLPTSVFYEVLDKLTGQDKNNVVIQEFRKAVAKAFA